ncbi:putative DNA-binding protein [Kosakonia radicincitans]|nr:putative DNA-binding protein [Kosakonia radicincitans]
MTLISDRMMDVTIQDENRKQLGAFLRAAGRVSIRSVWGCRAVAGGARRGCGVKKWRCWLMLASPGIPGWSRDGM